MKPKFIYYLLTAFLICLTCKGAAQFSNGLCALNNPNAAPYGIVQTTDGGHVLAGFTSQYGKGGNDMYAVKYDTNGNLAWARTVGGAGNDIATSIIASTDGGGVLAGYTNSFSGQTYVDVYIVKFDRNGNIAWTSLIGDTAESFGTSIINTPDGGYLVSAESSTFTGYNLYSGYFIKLDASGNIQWNRAIPCLAIDYVGAYAAVCGNGYLLACTGCCGFIYFAKIDALGNTLWIKRLYRYSVNSTFNLTGMAQLKNGNYALTAQGLDNNNWDIITWVMDSACHILGQRVYADSSNLSMANGITATADGGYMILGSNLPYSYTNPDSSGYLMAIHCDTLAKQIDGFASHGYSYTYWDTWAHYGSCITQDRDGGFSMGISGSSPFMYEKTDNKYNSCNTYKYTITPQPDSIIIYATGVMPTSGGFIGWGGTIDSGGTSSIYCRVTGLENINTNKVTVTVYPNPSNSIFNFEISTEGKYNLDVFNLLGEKVSSQNINNQTSFSIDMSNYSAGIYIYRISSLDGSVMNMGKLVVE